MHIPSNVFFDYLDYKKRRLLFLATFLPFSNVFFDYLDYKKRRLLFLATFLPFSRLIIFLKTITS